MRIQWYNGKPVILYTTLCNVVAVGELVTLTPVKGARLFTGPVTYVIPVIGDVRPLFETAHTIFIPVPLAPGAVTH